jgi:hypothetical protein
MSAILVSLDALKAFLSVEGDAEDALLPAILLGVEQHFVEQAGRAHRPFAVAASSARSEVHRGTGTTVLDLDYPVASLTAAITIGPDPADPAETLDPADPRILAITPGRRLIERVDGGTFGAEGAARAVHVTYDAQADAPPSAALAIKRVAAAVYRQLGAEGTGGERLGAYSSDLASVAEADPIWRFALEAQRGSGL